MCISQALIVCRSGLVCQATQSFHRQWRRRTEAASDRRDIEPCTVMALVPFHEAWKRRLGIRVGVESDINPSWFAEDIFNDHSFNVELGASGLFRNTDLLPIAGTADDFHRIPPLILLSYHHAARQEQTEDIKRQIAGCIHSFALHSGRHSASSPGGLSGRRPPRHIVTLILTLIPLGLPPFPHCQGFVALYFPPCR